jgi:hypothetical protein
VIRGEDEIKEGERGCEQCEVEVDVCLLFMDAVEHA